MKIKKVLYLVLILLAFAMGTQVDINFKTSPVFTSDVIAIVNNDQKVIENEEGLKFGDDFIRQLEDTDSQYQFQVTSQAEASQGLINGKYGASLTIPSNLTASILSVNSEKPIITNITYTMNNKLTPSKSSNMEKVIVENISKFEDNITYMYMYSIFDGLHTTQQGIEVVGENTQPIFPFLKTISEVNIVSNHEYELTKNNTDSFDKIDISKQLVEFSKTVAKYKSEITSVIDVYKTENEDMGLITEQNMSVIKEQNMQLNDDVENVEDTLETIVRDNQEFTADKYSITDSKSNLETIILLYLSQLKASNENYSQNQQVFENLSELDQNIEVLNLDSYAQEIYNFAKKRSNYYTSLDQIVNQCLSLSSTEAESCISKNIDSYQNDFATYNDYKRQFKTENDYYQTMTNYLTNIEATKSKNKDEHETIEFNVPIEYPSATTNVSEKSSKENTPIISGVNFSPNVTAEKDNQNNLIGLKIENTQDTEKIVLKITNSENIKAIKSQTTNLTNCKIAIKSAQIEITNINSSALNLLFDVETEDKQEPSKLELSYQQQSQNYTFGAKNPLTARAEIDRDNNLVLDYTYVFQSDNEQVSYGDSKLFTSNQQANWQISENAGGLVSISADGFTINGVGYRAGDEVKFQITTDNLSGKQFNVENYKIGSNEYSFPIITENINVKTNLSIVDDPFVHTSNQVINDEDDDNQQIEADEKIGLKYQVALTTENQLKINQVKFKIEGLMATINDLNTSEFFVINNNKLVNSQININQNQVTINFEQPLATTSSGSQQQVNFDIYLNPTVKSSITNLSEDDNQVSFDNLQVKNQQLEIQTTTVAAANLKLTAGNPLLSGVKYQAVSSECTTDGAINSCQFEAGDLIERTITITNQSNESAPSLTLSDNLNSTDLITNIATEYKFAALDDDPSFDVDESELITMNADGQINFSMPANSSLVISQKIQLQSDIFEPSEFVNKLDLMQFETDAKGKVEVDLTVVPLPLELKIIDDEQLVADGVITPNEAVNIEVELRNNSQIGTSNQQVIKLTPADSKSIADVKVMSIEDEEWNPIPYTQISTDAININHSLEQNKTYTVKLRIVFNGLEAASSSQTITICGYQQSLSASKPSSCDEISYNLAIDPDYLQLARKQAAEGLVLNEETYSSSLSKTNTFIDQTANVTQLVQKIVSKIPAYNQINNKLDQFTTLTNDQIDEITNQITKYGLGLESRTDENTQAEYSYCTDNTELSCKIFDTYNKITTKEINAKNRLQSILNTIDPRIDEVISTKQSDDDNILPTNVGADFNGYERCEPQQNDDNSNSKDECTSRNLGINQQINAQLDNLDVLSKSIRALQKNEPTKVDGQPYNQQLAEAQAETNNAMSQVETKNNQLYNEKIDVYNKNYETVQDYLTAINEDSTYQDLIKDFAGTERVRQSESRAILESVYNLLPNTSLNGVPNKLVYSFIASPFATKQVTSNQPVETTPSTSQKWLPILQICIFIVIVLLIGIHFYIKRGE